MASVSPKAPRKKKTYQRPQVVTQPIAVPNLLTLTCPDSWVDCGGYCAPDYPEC